MTYSVGIEGMRKPGKSRHERRCGVLASQLMACWTYERFHHRLERSDRAEAGDPLSSRLESVHARLRSIRESLGDDDADDPEADLDEIETELRRSAAELLAEDSRVGASDLRRFLTRVRRLDEDLLVGLLRFYLLAHRDESWDPTVVDKIDFLLSRLGEEISGPLLERDRVRLHATLEALWRRAGSEPPPPTVLAALRRQVEAVRRELGEIPDLDGLDDSGIIPRYRRLKHGLGRLLVEPSLTEEVLRTNAALSRTVRRLHAAEEWQIATDFARLRELEARHGLPEALSLEIESLHHDMELYEQGRRWDDVRLDTLHRLRRELRDIQPHIAELLADEEVSDESESRPQPQSDAAPEVTDDGTAEPAGPGRPVPLEEPAARSDLRWELVGQLYRGLESVVEAASSLDEAEEVLRDPGLPYDLEQRELAAFLVLRDGGGAEATRERLVFTAASVRYRLGALREALEDGQDGQDGKALRAARGSLRLAEDLLEELGEEVAAAAVAVEQEWTETLRLSRVLLMRDYAALWLEVHGAG